MRRIKIYGATFFVVLALGAMYASSAMAVEQGQWLKNSAPITTAQSAFTAGTWLLLALSLFGFVKTHIVCDGYLIGTVGPGAEDQVTEITSLSRTSPVRCEVLKSELGSCPGSETAYVTAGNLRWKTLLLKKLDSAMEWEFIDHYLSSGVGNPTYKFQCTLSGGALSEELCEFMEFLSDALSNVPGAGVFGKILNELSTKCEKSGTMIHLYGQGTTALLSGTLTVSP